MNASSTMPPTPITMTSIERNEGQVASMPDRFALVPSNPNWAARSGSRTIHMKSARPSGAIENAPSVPQVTRERRSFKNSVARTCAIIGHHRLGRRTLGPVAGPPQEVALEVGGEQRLLALLGGERGPHVGARPRREVLARRLLDEAARRG